MADKISVSYDANIDDMKRKLEELIALNNRLKRSSEDVSGAYSKAGSSISSANASVAQSTTVINNYNNSVNNTTNNVTRMGSAVNNASRQVSGFDAGIGKLGKGIIAAFSVQTLINFGKGLIQLEREFEMIQNRMNFVFDTADRGEAGFNRLRNLSMRLGLDVKETANAFSTFGIAAKMAGFSAEESENIFTKVAVSLRGAGANSLQTSRSFYALQQMLSKGVVSAEELRRQLGESLPGASDLMAEAYQRLHPEVNVTNLMFNKLLESGKILSAEVLPEFANVLEDTFSPAVEAKMTSLDAAINRLSNGFDALRLSILNAKAVSGTINDLGGYLDNLGVAIRSNENGIIKFFRVFGSILDAGFFGNTNDLKEAAKVLREREADIQRMDDLANKGRDKYVQNIADRFLQIFGGDFSKAIQAQGRLLREEMKKSTKDLSEEEKKQRELRIENARLVLSELNKMQTQAESSFQDNKEAEEKAALDATKAEIAAAKELLAAEETRLVATTEGTTAYYNQLVKVIEARKNLAKIEQRDTPQAMGLSLAKLDKDLEKARKMVESFDPNVAEVIEEGVYVPPVEALQRLDKEIKKQREAELELAIVTAKKLVETTEEGTQERANAEQWLALEVAELEKFKVTISTDSEELKAAKIALINEELKNQLKKIDLDYAKDQKEIQDKIVEDQQKTQDRIADIIQNANDLIERTEGDSFQRRIARSNQMFEDMARKLKEEMSQTSDFNLLAELIKKLNEVENAGKKAASAISFEKAGEVLDSIGGLYGDLSRLQAVSYENDAISLKKQLDQKLISEQEYERKAAELARKRFEHEKQVATVSAIIEGASGVMKAIGKGRWWDVGVIAASTAIQIATIQSQQFPGFKEGVIDLQGSGTGTSDSIPARLSRGESVMTADETKRYKPVLQAIRDNNFEEFASKRYIDAMGGQSVSSAVGNSFAENLTNSFDLQTAELAHLLKQNRKVAIKNVDELAKAMSRRNTTEKVINRRRFK